MFLLDKLKAFWAYLNKPLLSNTFVDANEELEVELLNDDEDKQAPVSYYMERRMETVQDSLSEDEYWKGFEYAVERAILSEYGIVIMPKETPLMTVIEHILHNQPERLESYKAWHANTDNISIRSKAFKQHLRDRNVERWINALEIDDDDSAADFGIEGI